MGRHFLILWSFCESIYLLIFIHLLKNCVQKVVALYIFFIQGLKYFKRVHKSSASTELYGLYIFWEKYELKIYKKWQRTKNIFIFIINIFFQTVTYWSSFIPPFFKSCFQNKSVVIKTKWLNLALAEHQIRNCNSSCFFTFLWL